MNIRELAKLAGVSKTTAAYAIKNNPRVSQEVRERVQKLAQEHGYQQSPVVKAFMHEMRRGKAYRERLYSLCYITSLDKTTRVSRLRAYAFERDIFEGARDEAEALGYPLEVITLDPEALSQQRLKQIIQAKGIRGLFIGPGGDAFTQLELDLDQLATISFGYTITEPELDRIASDLLLATKEAANRAFERRYRTIIFAITPNHDDRVGNRWTSGAGALHALHGGRKIRILRDRFNVLVEKLVPLIQRCPAPVVLGESNLIEGLAKSGIRIPRDCGFVALSTNIQSNHTAIIQPNYQIGKLGIERLSMKVERSQWGIPETPTRTVLKCDWQEGETLPQR